MPIYVPFKNGQLCYIPIPLRASAFYKLNEAGLVISSLFFTLGLKPNAAAPFIFNLCLHLPFFASLRGVRSFLIALGRDAQLYIFTI